MKSFIFILSFSVSILALASRTESLSDDALSVRIGTTAPTLPLEISPPTGSTADPLVYEQNANTKFGVGADYKWLGFFISTNDITSELSPATYGSTDYFDLQFHIYQEKWGLDLYYQDFQGYYLENTTAVLGGTCCEIREDIRSRFYGANFFYVFNPENISYVAAGNLTAIQKTSGGSWSLYGGYATQLFSTDSTLAPSAVDTDYGTLGNLSSGTFHTLVFGGGYGYTAVLGGPWFVHFSLQLGIGPQIQNFDTQDLGSYNLVTASAKGTARLGLGWSGEKSFGAIQAIGDSTGFSLDEEFVSFNSLLTFVSIGWRFYDVF